LGKACQTGKSSEEYPQISNNNIPTVVEILGSAHWQPAVSPRMTTTTFYLKLHFFLTFLEFSFIM
jgi:hypothetical protein